MNLWQNMKKAIDYYKRALANTADVEMVWQNIGDCYRYLGRYEEALRAYNNAEESDRNANYGGSAVCERRL